MYLAIFATPRMLQLAFDADTRLDESSPDGDLIIPYQLFLGLLYNTIKFKATWFMLTYCNSSMPTLKMRNHNNALLFVRKRTIPYN